MPAPLVAFNHSKKRMLSVTDNFIVGMRMAAAAVTWNEFTILPLCAGNSNQPDTDVLLEVDVPGANSTLIWIWSLIRKVMT
jgi:hypothetical protein